MLVFKLCHVITYLAPKLTLLNSGWLVWMALSAPTSTTVVVKEPGAFWEMGDGIGVLLFVFPLLEPWIKVSFRRRNGTPEDKFHLKITHWRRTFFYVTAQWTFKIVILPFEVTSEVCNETLTFITKMIVETCFYLLTVACRVGRPQAFLTLMPFPWSPR